MECPRCGEFILPGAEYCDCGLSAAAAASGGSPRPHADEEIAVSPAAAPTSGEAEKPEKTVSFFTSLTGIGLGSMTIILERLNYVAGETIHGILTLTLKVPVQADRLWAGLLAYREHSEYVTRSNGEKEWVKTQNNIYQYTYEVGGKGEYRSYDFPISFVIPHDACPPPPYKPEGVLENVVHILASANKSISPVYWIVHGSLEIPWKFPIRKQVSITVSRPLQ